MIENIHKYVWCYYQRLKDEQNQQKSFFLLFFFEKNQFFSSFFIPILNYFQLFPEENIPE